MNLVALAKMLIASPPTCKCPSRTGSRPFAQLLNPAGSRTPRWMSQGLPLEVVFGELHGVFLVQYVAVERLLYVFLKAFVSFFGSSQ